MIINESAINTCWDPWEVVLTKETSIFKKSTLKKKMTRSEMKDQTSRDDLHRKSIQRRNMKLSKQATVQQQMHCWKRTQASASLQEGMLWQCPSNASRKMVGGPGGGCNTSNSKPNQTNKTFASFYQNICSTADFKSSLRAPLLSWLENPNSKASW